MKKILFVLSLTFLILPASAQSLNDKAVSFINSLSDELKSSAVFSFENEERFNMNYVPMVRTGPTFNDFNERQSAAAIELLRASLSAVGFEKTKEIMALEEVLKAIEKNPGRDPLNYHFCIFGDPSNSEYWAWRFEGHHISLNFSIKDNKIISSTPSFLGTNPAIIDIRGHKRREVLKMEFELGLMLVNLLSGSQLKKARFSETAPKEILVGVERKANELLQKGIHYSELDENQQLLLRKLLDLYIDNYELGFSKTLRTKVEKAGIDNLSFAWAGGLSSDGPTYYRIQGPMLIIEFDNTQNNANHIHTIVRDLTNDFAFDILSEHYRKEHK